MAAIKFDPQYIFIGKKEGTQAPGMTTSCHNLSVEDLTICQLLLLNTSAEASVI